MVLIISATVRTKDAQKTGPRIGTAVVATRAILKIRTTIWENASAPMQKVAARVRRWVKHAIQALNIMPLVVPITVHHVHTFLPPGITYASHVRQLMKCVVNLLPVVEHSNVHLIKIQNLDFVVNRLQIQKQMGPSLVLLQRIVRL